MLKEISFFFQQTMSSCSFFNRCSGNRTTGTVPKFGPQTTALEIVRGLQARLDGRVVLITGATSGK